MKKEIDITQKESLIRLRTYLDIVSSYPEKRLSGSEKQFILDVVSLHKEEGYAMMGDNMRKKLVEYTSTNDNSTYMMRLYRNIKKKGYLNYDDVIPQIYLDVYDSNLELTIKI